MRKAILRILLVICGVNVFTSCYGMPPGDWVEPTPIPEEQGQTKTSEPTVENLTLEESEGGEY